MYFIRNRIVWGVFVALCLMIGLYPLVYLFADAEFGILSSKQPELLSDTIWNVTFYTHIFVGGLALLIGWTQFSSKLREKRLNLHRSIGKLYVLSVLISGLCGLYVGYYATGGIVSTTGFMSLAVIWLSTTFIAYRAVKARDLKTHEKMMIYSYAACFAAVTLRVWLPLLSSYYGEFIPAYRIVAWLCWVPNIIVAYFIANKYFRKKLVVD